MDSRDTAMAGPELTLLGMNFGVPTDACEAGIGGLSTAGTATADRQAEPCTAVRWMSSTAIVCKAAPIKDWNPVGPAALTHSLTGRPIASLPLVGNAHRVLLLSCWRACTVPLPPNGLGRYSCTERSPCTVQTNA
jgi:hypothetical protein